MYACPRVMAAHLPPWLWAAARARHRGTAIHHAPVGLARPAAARLARGGLQELARFTRVACSGMHHQGMLYPPLSSIVQATTAIAAAIAVVAFAADLTSVPRPAGDLATFLDHARYWPSYPTSAVGASAAGALPADESASSC